MVPPQRVTISHGGEEEIVTISSAPAVSDVQERLIVALADKWQLLADLTIDEITASAEGNGERLLAIKGIGPATVEKIREVVL